VVASHRPRLCRITLDDVSPGIELGGAVGKGETGTTIVFASSFSRTETTKTGTEIEQDIPFLKTYTVFNTDQIAGLDGRFDEILPVQKMRSSASKSIYHR
jgi:antirestriction protein ArdC